MSDFLQWGILATGRIAHAFAQGLRHAELGRLAAAASRSRESAERFGAEYGLPAAYCHGSYEALLADETVQAVYIATPHPGHAEWAIRCAEAGKHILCEKPLAVNARDAGEIVAAARRNKVFLMEAFMYRCHPQTQRLAELVRSGAIGRVRMIQAAFSFQAPVDPKSRLFDPALGGGGILDVGGYPVSMARLIAGAANGQPFAEPIEFRAMGEIGETGVDESATALVRFPGGVLAQLSCGIRLWQDNAVRIYGEEGWLHVPEPWLPARDGGTSRVFLHRPGRSEPEVMTFPTPENRPAYLYAIEADHVARHIAQGEAPAMTWDDSLGNMRALDRWRDSLHRGGVCGKLPGGMTPGSLDRITSEPGKCGGRPCIRGLRMRVKDVLELLAAGASHEEILTDYPFLEAADITACLEFAAAQSDHALLKMA